jgi:hypothetical protein
VFRQIPEPTAIAKKKRSVKEKGLGLGERESRRYINEGKDKEKHMSIPLQKDR